MNRRRFLTGTIATAALLPTIRSAALDVDVIENPIIQVFKLLPDHPAEDGFDFPITTGTNGPLQRSVWPENPDRYWDPEGEDYYTIFGFYPTWMERRGSQAGISLWQMNTSAYTRTDTHSVLESNGWEVVDDDLQILQYTGSEDDRKVLAGELNVLGSWMIEGYWDWVALPDDASVVVGTNADRIRTIADRIKNHTAIESVDLRFHDLEYVLRADAYLVSLLPHQRLPISGTSAAFICRSWNSEPPIIHSVGLSMESKDLVEPIISILEKRLAAESSPVLRTPYSDFLNLVDVTTYRQNVRFDFVDNSGEWDVFDALNSDDLRMLPLPKSES